MRRALLLTAVVAAAVVSSVLVGIGLTSTGSASTDVNTQLAADLRSCPGETGTDMGLFVVGLPCKQALDDVQSVERVGTPGVSCPPGWTFLESDRIPNINPPGSGRPPLAVCFQQTRHGLEAYTFDIDSLVG